MGSSQGPGNSKYPWRVSKLFISYSRRACIDLNRNRFLKVFAVKSILKSKRIDVGVYYQLCTKLYAGSPYFCEFHLL